MHGNNDHGGAVPGVVDDIRIVIDDGNYRIPILESPNNRVKFPTFPVGPVQNEEDGRRA